MALHRRLIGRRPNAGPPPYSASIWSHLAPFRAALGVLGFVAALTGLSCEASHYDMYLGTDAGRDFDAPARDVGVDGGADDATAAVILPVDAGDVVDAGGDAGD
jgi:hypothetical protein